MMFDRPIERYYWNIDGISEDFKQEGTRRQIQGKKNERVQTKED